MTLSLRRIMALLRKEFIQIRRDRLTFAMLLGVPIAQLLMFGFAINTDPREMPSALVASSGDRFARAMVVALENTGYYRFVATDITAIEGEQMLTDGTVAFVVTLPADFGTRMLRGERPQLLIEADATDPAAASGAISTLGTVATEALERELGVTTPPAGPDIVVHRRYNPEGITQDNIVPALLGIILQMTMVMMTSMALTREIERGTMENLLAMPATPIEIMAGKITPFVVVGAVQVAVVLVAARAIFRVPFEGSLVLLLSGVMVFIVALVLLGYLISTVSRTQMQAMQLSVFAFLPSILLSGFMFPFLGMPVWARMIGEVLPVTHFLRLVRAVMLKGAGLENVRPQIIALLVITAVLAVVALTRFRQTLD